MDPVSIVGIVEGSISLAVQCGGVAKKLNTLAGQYKHAKLTLSTMVQNLNIMQYAWDRIGNWSKGFMPTDDEGFAQRLEQFLETGSLVLKALEDDLQSYDSSKMSFGQRSRLAWNEDRLQGHQNRIRDQAQSMNILLQAVQLPTQQATNNLLQQSEKQFMKSDESAFSIVPSNLSSRLSMFTGQTWSRDSIGSHASMVYRHLSFENDLFTARVYKRNYRSPLLKRLWKKERNHVDRGNETFTLLENRHQNNESVAEQKSQRATRDKDTTIVLKDTAKLMAEQDAERPIDAIKVTTDADVGRTNKEHSADSPKPASKSFIDLLVACGRGDHDSVRRLLRMMPESRIEDPEVPTLLESYLSDLLYHCPIYAAVSNGHVEVMKILLGRAELEKDIGRVLEKPIGGIKDDVCRPLHLAITKNNLPMVELLLEKGASVSSETAFGTQAVHLAAKFGSMKMLAALIEAGADIDCTDRYGKTAIHYTSNPDIEMYLLSLDLDEYLGSDESPSSDSESENHCTQDVKTLLSEEVLPDQSPQAFESTPSQLARKSDPKCDDQAPLTDQALDNAIRLGLPYWVETLIKEGSDPNHCRSDGGTGLHTFLRFYATVSHDESSDKSILRLLLDQIDILARDQNGETVLGSLLQLGAKELGAKVGTKRFVLTIRTLAKLFLECLPEHKVLEKKVLTSMMNVRSGEIKNLVSKHNSGTVGQ